LTSLHYKSPEETRNRKAYVNIINTIDDKSKPNIVLNDEKLKAFSLKSRTRKGHLLSPLLFNVNLNA
jgi:hypothetical protein